MNRHDYQFWALTTAGILATITLIISLTRSTP